jgi:cytochrome c-type biogenesis protein CcmH
VIKMRPSRRKVRAGLAALFLLAASTGAIAVEPDEMLADPGLEARARALSAELRCLVCQNQSIDDSNAPLARDLRILVRERLKAGDSDAAVKDFIVGRYGSFVLLRPPFDDTTFLLWAMPFAILLGTGAAIVWKLKARPKRIEPPSRPLTPEEGARLREVLEQSGRKLPDDAS